MVPRLSRTHDAHAQLRLAVRPLRPLRQRRFLAPERDSARRAWDPSGYSSPRAFMFGDYPRSLLAFDPGRQALGQPCKGLKICLSDPS